jgi:hypothetical protein
MEIRGHLHAMATLNMEKGSKIILGSLGKTLSCFRHCDEEKSSCRESNPWLSGMYAAWAGGGQPETWAKVPALRAWVWIIECLRGPTHLTLIFGMNTWLAVKAPCHKPEGCGFKIWWGERIFSIYLIITAALRPGFTQKWAPHAEK